ncbi:MAG: UDP pyrophosphate phosphatase [Bacilli bacterium]|nr:UDP pyrophosphate phosphatase [Bacilli bacterium]MDD4076883.1 undecaprenyl-diphosphate phosphatase [Bacilli bacterium]MDD4387879.1 undecaprenyl-diphosphate phosphatase [Bacilli bacterium]
MKIIEFLKYIALGLVQGITEPLPISSSGHMIILNSVFGKILTANDMNNFQIITNFASLLAIIFYYRRLIGQIGAGSWYYITKKKAENKKDFLYLLYIVIATIPAGIAGVTIKLLELDVYYTNIVCVGICLFITGNLLLFSHRMAPLAEREEITLKDSLLMGGAQVIGLLPGISRSGVTTSFAVGNKVKLDKAFRFSFMMYIPASIGAAIIGMYDLIKQKNISDSVFVFGYIGAFIASLIGTYLALSLFFKLLKNKNLKYFGYYCIIVSIIVIFLIALGIF